MQRSTYEHLDNLLGCSGDLVSQLSNTTYWAYYGFLSWLRGILAGLTKSTDHPSNTIARVTEMKSLPDFSGHDQG